MDEEHDEQKIGAILPYFGGKRTMAPLIVDVLGKHNSYWEIFAGSMAILLEKKPSASEAVNDLNGKVINLARVLASDAAVTLYDRLERTLFCEPLFHEILGRAKAGSDDPIENAYTFFVESWMGKNGIAGTRAANTAFCRRYTSNGGDPAMRFKNAVDSIPAWHHRLRTVQIHQTDGIELATRIEDKEGTVVIADPPYLVKGAKYTCDFKPGDHERLAEALHRFKKTRVVCCYYEHPDLASLYPGWTKINAYQTKALVSHGQRDGTNDVVAPEVLLVNGPEYTVPVRGLFGHV